MTAGLHVHTHICTYICIHRDTQIKRKKKKTISPCSRVLTDEKSSWPCLTRKTNMSGSDLEDTVWTAQLSPGSGKQERTKVCPRQALTLGLCHQQNQGSSGPHLFTSVHRRRDTEAPVRAVRCHRGLADFLRSWRS